MGILDSLKTLAKKVAEETIDFTKKVIDFYVPDLPTIKDTVEKAKDVAEKIKDKVDLTEDDVDELIEAAESLEPTQREIERKIVKEVVKPIVLFDRGLGSMRNGTKIGYDRVKTRYENQYEARIYWYTSDGRGHEKEVTFSINAKWRRIYFDDVLKSEASIKTPYNFEFPDQNKSTPRIRIEVDSVKSDAPREDKPASLEELKTARAEGGTEEETIFDQEGIWSKVKFIVGKIWRPIEGEGVVSNVTPFPMAAGAGTAAAAGAGGIGTGLASALGIQGLSSKAAVTKITAKGLAGIASADILMVWMAEDNILTGSGFTIRKLKESVSKGIITRENALKEAEKVEKWALTAANLVISSANVNPLLIPFKEILLTNVEKGLYDVAVEKNLLAKAGDEEKDKLKDEKSDLIKFYKDKWAKEDLTRIKAGRKQRSKKEKVQRLNDEIELLKKKKEIDDKISKL